MTLKEAVGIKSCNIDAQTGEKVEHSEIYGRIIEYLGGLDAVAKYIPFSISFIKEKIKDDVHLNNTSMDKWDYASGFKCNGSNVIFLRCGIWALYAKHGINSASNSDGVCILKEAARRLAEME